MVPCPWSRDAAAMYRGEKVLNLIESLNENDDVHNVYDNFEISDALVNKMSA